MAKITLSEKEVRKIQLRRDNVLNLYCKGLKVEEIAKKEGVAISTVSEDLKAIRESIIQNHAGLANKIIEEIALSIVGLNEGLRKIWQIIEDPDTAINEKLRAIYLLSCLYRSKADFLDSQHMIDVAITKSH
jgi:hypothetical protein